AYSVGIQQGIAYRSVVWRQRPTLENPLNKIQRLRAPGLLTTERAKLLKYLTRIGSISKLPLEEQIPAMEKMETLAVDPLLVEAASLDMRVPSFKLLKDHVLEFQQMRIQLRCAIVMIALERYRMDHKTWPNSLADVVPQSLKELPIDPYSGKALRYR